MRILFVLKGLALVRHFDEVVAHLADAGHQIILAPMKLGDEELLPEALSSHANCDVVVTSAKRTEAAHSTGILRQARDYLRYWEPWLAGAEANRRRALSHLLRAVSGNTRDPGVDLPGAWSLSKNEVRCLRRLFDEVERFLPPAPTVERFIAAQRPDVMLVTPLVSFGGAQADYVKAARRLGIPSACPVFSWDNLTNKGVMHERPDRTFVWNEVQRQEAIRMHGVAPEDVIATGAPRFDSFFRRTPSSTREEYCRVRGLDPDPDRRLIAYLGSSPIVAAREPIFVERWTQALRASPETSLRYAQVVIRPHPRNKGVWQEHPGFAEKAHDTRLPDVVVTHPKSATGDEDLFDDLFHADVVVGLNTTAELEAGILGKPVYTVRATEFAAGQTGSHHFQYLLRDHGGFVECAATLDQHLVQLADGLAGRFDREQIRAFVVNFLRPRGADLPVAPLLATEIERWAHDATVRRETRASGDPSGGKGAAGAEARDAGPPSDQTGLITSDDPVETDRPVKTPLIYDRHPLFIYVSTYAEREWRLDPGRKEPWTVAWLDASVRPDDVVYDVGANVGVFSLIAAANLGRRGTVVAFEPGYANFSRLCENIRLNRFTRRIVPVPVPLSNRCGLQGFRYKSLEPGQSRHRFAAQPWNPMVDKTKASDQPVLAISLEHAVRDFGFPPPTLMKIDVDGAEDLVLAGAGALLQAETLRSVIAEIDPQCEAAVLDTLERAGLELTERFKRKKKVGTWSGVFRRR